MSIRFQYTRLRTTGPVVSLGGRRERPRPLIPVAVIGPAGSRSVDALLDTGADDTVLPESLAKDLGIDLTTAPAGTSSGVVRGSVAVRFAEVTLRIASNQERREWRGWVGFTPLSLRQPLLGYAGFLQYFDVTFFGTREEVELTVNASYPGT